MSLKPVNGVVVRRPVQPRFIPIREPVTQRLLFKYDPTRMLIEIQWRGKKTIVDLTTIDTEHNFE